MTPEQAVLERILDIAAVTAIIGTRAWMLKLPQGGSYPAVRVQLIDEGGIAHLRGSGGPKRTRVQVDAFAAESSGADPYAAANELAEAINGDGSGEALDGWQGSSGGSPAITLTGVLRVDRGVMYDADEQRLVRVRQDYMVGWTPA